MTSATLIVAVDVPIDWMAGLCAPHDAAAPLEKRLLSQLPGPRWIWSDGAASIVGFVMKKAIGGRTRS